MPTIFSVMEEPVSDAKKIDSASEKSVFVQKTMVSTRKTIALIVETMVSIAGKTVSGILTAVCAFEEIVLMPENIL